MTSRADALEAAVYAYFTSTAWLTLPTKKGELTTCVACGAPYSGSSRTMKHDAGCPVARLWRALEGVER